MKEIFIHLFFYIFVVIRAIISETRALPVELLRDGSCTLFSNFSVLWLILEASEVTDVFQDEGIPLFQTRTSLAR